MLSPSFQPYAKIVIIASFLFLVSTIGYAENRKIKVGVSVPLSGGLSSWGNSIKNAIILADKELDTNNDVEFIIEDDQFTPRNALSIAKKFIDRDKVQALLIFGSGSAFAIGPLAEQQQVPMIAFGTAIEISKGKKYSMIHWLVGEPENRAAVGEIKRRGYKTLAVVSTIQDGMLALRDKLKRDLPDAVVYDTEVNPADLDFMSIATRIKAKNVDAVYNLLLPPQSSAFAKQIRAIGFKGDIFSAHQVEDWKEIEASQGSLLDTWFVSANSLNDKNFINRYEKAFNDQPKAGAGNGYDCAKMLIEGSQEQDLNSYLHNLQNFNGILGTYGYNAEGYFEVQPVIKKITAAGFELE